MKNNMKKILIIIMALSVVSIIIGLKLYNSGKIDKSYGVFLSLDGRDDEDGSIMKRLKQYETVVIDAEYYTKRQIKSLHDNGQKVYSYVNIGSIESFRDCYNEFSELSLGEYENWEEEDWVDVSNEKWQRHIENIAQEYIDKGVDGFYIDNTDVYYTNPRDEIYNGVVDILRNLMKKDLPVIINGGDYFVQKYYEKNNTVKDILTGINQETVFSAIDFDKKELKRAKKDNEEYYYCYIDKFSDLGVDIYLLEYTKDNEIKNEIIECCEKKGWKYYISDSIELD